MNVRVLCANIVKISVLKRALTAKIVRKNGVTIVCGGYRGGGAHLEYESC